MLLSADVNGGVLYQKWIQDARLSITKLHILMCLELPGLAPKFDLYRWARAFYFERVWHRGPSAGEWFGIVLLQLLMLYGGLGVI